MIMSSLTFNRLRMRTHEKNRGKTEFTHDRAVTPSGQNFTFFENLQIPGTDSLLKVLTIASHIFKTNFSTRLNLQYTKISMYIFNKLKTVQHDKFTCALTGHELSVFFSLGRYWKSTDSPM